MGHNPDMGNKTSKSIEVESLRARLARMPRSEVLALAKRAKVSASTLQKFRGRFIADIGADKYAAINAVLLAEQSA